MISPIFWKSTHLKGHYVSYFLKAVKWARKYGLRINLDLHTAPGSQNGWNHSGKIGSINVGYGPMGVANAQRTLDYIRIIAEFISQPEYRDVVPLFSVLNEPFGPTVGLSPITALYVLIRSLSRPFVHFYCAIDTSNHTALCAKPLVSEKATAHM